MKIKERKFPHYYGDSVRKLFLLGAIVMVLALPSLHIFVPGNTHLGLFIIVILGLISGLISPFQKTVITLNLFISLIAVAVFEYHAVATFSGSLDSLFFWVNQVLAVVFLLALYYSSKTFRGMILDRKSDNDN
ncbi:MAG: hypothetical protein WD471_01325 [Candidatus Paceibacterota bacterium]